MCEKLAYCCLRLGVSFCVSARVMQTGNLTSPSINMWVSIPVLIEKISVWNGNLILISTWHTIDASEFKCPGTIVYINPEENKSKIIHNGEYLW